MPLKLNSMNSCPNDDKLKQHVWNVQKGNTGIYDGIWDIVITM